MKIFPRPCHNKHPSKLVTGSQKSVLLPQKLNLGIDRIKPKDAGSKNTISYVLQGFRILIHYLHAYPDPGFEIFADPDPGLNLINQLLFFYVKK